MSSPPTLIVFDIDGTLLDSTTAHLTALTSVLRGMKLNPDSKPWATYRHYTDSGVLDELLEDTRGSGATAVDLACLDRELRAEFAALTSTAPLSEIAGARRLLKHLEGSDDIRVAFATGSMRGVALQKLRALGLEPDAHLIATGSEFLAREHIVLEVLNRGTERWGQPLSVVLVGDGAWDERVARTLGVPIVGVETGLHRFGSGADLVVPDLRRLSDQDLRAAARPFALR